MKKVNIRQHLLTIFMVFAMVVVILINPTPGAATSIKSQLSWTTSYQGTAGTSGAVTNISCPSDSFCAVGGIRGTGASFISFYIEGTWVATTINLPTTLGSTSEITGISCWSSSNCVAVGNYAVDYINMPFAAVWDGSIWRVTTVFPGLLDPSGSRLNSLSCAKQNFCVAVGKLGQNGGSPSGAFGLTFDGTSWTVSQFTNGFTDGEIASLQTVTCLSTQFCMAGGYVGVAQRESQQAFIELWDGSSWMPSIIGAESNPGGQGYVSSISCASITSCVAGGSVGDINWNLNAFVSSWDGAKWTSQLLKSSEGFLLPGRIVSSSCAGDQLCVVVGNNGNQPFDVRYDGTSWTTELRGTSITDGTAFPLRSISCPAIDLCVAVGGLTSRYISTFDGSNWTDRVSSPAYYQPLLVVGCHTSSVCMTGGTFATAYDNRSPIVLLGKPPTSPAAPGNVVVTPGRRSVTVSWSPANDGGQSPVTYTASDSLGHSCTTTELSCTIIGLTPGVPAGIGVTAENSIGSSPSSEISSGIAFDVPTSPLNATAQPIGSSVVTGFSISWSPPTSDGFTPITGYEVTSAPQLRYVCDPQGTTCNVFGATPGASYTFSVVALNAAGRSSSASVTAISKGVPSAPEGVTVAPSVGGATVNWRPSSQSNGASVLGYRVTVLGDHRTFTTVNTKLQIGGLPVTSLSQISIASFNSIGFSRETTSDQFQAWSGPNGAAGLLLTPNVISPRGTTTLVIASQIPSSSLSVAWVGAPNGSCFTNNAGQCTMQLSPSKTGVFPIVVSGSKLKTLITTLYVPNVDAPNQIRHGLNAMVKVSNCPPGSVVTVTISDGRKLQVKSSTSGLGQLLVSTPKQGTLNLQVSIGAAQNLFSKSIVVF